MLPVPAPLKCSIWIERRFKRLGGPGSGQNPKGSGRLIIQNLYFDRARRMGITRPPQPRYEMFDEML